MRIVFVGRGIVLRSSSSVGYLSFRFTVEVGCFCSMRCEVVGAMIKGFYIDLFIARVDC